MNQKQAGLSRLTGIVRRRVIGFSEIIAFLSLMGICASLLAKHHFLLDACSHFRLQAICSLVATGTVLVIFHRKKWFGSLALFVGIGLAVSVIPWFVKAPSRGSSSQFRLLSFNILTSNPNKEQVSDLILRENSDLVVLYEVNREWVMALNRKLAPDYPHQINRIREDNFGVAAFSKTPFASAEIVNFSDNGVPSLDLKFNFPGNTPVRIVGTHPVPPTNPAYWKERNSQLKELAKYISQSEIPTIACGDFNSSPWSPFMKEFMKTTGLVDSARGYGIFPTWTGLSFLFGMPIDHVFQSTHFEVTARKVINFPGSDHRGIIVDYAFTEK